MKRAVTYLIVGVLLGVLLACVIVNAYIDSTPTVQSVAYEAWTFALLTLGIAMLLALGAVTFADVRRNRYSRRRP